MSVYLKTTPAQLQYLRRCAMLKAVLPVVDDVEHFERVARAASEFDRNGDRLCEAIEAQKRTCLRSG